MERGVQVQSGGVLDQDLQRYGRRLKRDPLDSGALTQMVELSKAFARKDQNRQAIEALTLVTEAAPDLLQARCELAWLHAVDRADDLALRHARVALALEPASVAALCAQVSALCHLRRFDEAEPISLNALTLAPHDPRALHTRAELLFETNRFAESFSCFRLAVELEPDNRMLLAAYADALERNGDIGEALAVYDRAQAVAPASIGLMFSRARCLRDLGRTDSAQTLFEDVVRRDPRFSPAYRALIRMKTFEDTPASRKRLLNLATDASAPELYRVQAGFALGDLLADARDYDSAFEQYSAANRLHKAWRLARGQSYVPKEMDRTLALVSERFGQEFAHVPTDWGNPSDRPIFIVGLTRSGTTLVEQICASHSQVIGLGERSDMIAASAAIEVRNRDRAQVKDWDSGHFRAEADDIASRLSLQSGDALRFIDKNPSNILRLGLIGAMFPRARVIWCRRDPRDVIVSNHTLYFSNNIWSTDLLDAAHAVRRVDQLGGIWKEHLQIPMLEVVYEDLVADLETNVRRIIDFLDLDWEPSCLNFHETDRRVATPSEWQVRQPIYSSSVGRWRRYERQLAPMLQALETPLPPPSVA